ncbi:efflux RND transporter periplasmic adaptor subunit [Fulvivirga lutimaris]|uniref:efflux RND transporter periplasmic adaptor subunit n=1 Tax=Fulvivirga lutimaris TaxID=1819566 RepID=UPI0012BB9B22|nr:HlyD family efflux transporter periplasmic adaptor subunit [Fulvivirga lutimaris]MTI38723.1 HlyD family efflux transporter periplasmic adaptor subunit [Fulvivirga lutimaris]
MKLRQVIIVGIGLTILFGSFILSGALSSMKEPPEVKTPEEIKKYVKTEKVKYSSIPTEVMAFGRVKTAESLDLIAEVSGRMKSVSIPLKEGQRFNRGALLYKIDDREARLNLQSQKSNFLKELAAILPDMKIDFSENYEAWSKYFSEIDINKPLPEMPAYKNDKEKTFLATKNIFSSFYTIKSAEVNLNKYSFYAPFGGVISMVDLQSGSFVNPGNKIGTILRSDKLEMKVDVSVSDIDWVELGSQAQVVTESGRIWEGKVARIGEFVNQNTQSIDVFIAINSDKDRKIYDGEYLRSIIPGREVESGMLVPRNAIFDGNKVFVLQDSLLKVEEIQIHKLNAESVVFSGLKEGSELVVEPLINAHNNMKAFKLEEKEDIDIEQKSSDVKLVKN